MVLGVLLFFAGGYYLVALCIDPDRARVLTTPLDPRIPFVPASIYLYALVYPAALLPAFVVRCPRLFARVVRAYLFVIGVSLTSFALFPVTASGLRPDPALLDPNHFDTWGVRLLYTLDPPTNLFPSLHLAVALLAALATWKARRIWGAVALASSAAIAVSVCTVKQHYAVDAMAGLVMAAAAYSVLISPYRPAPETVVAYGWRGPALYAVLVAALYAGCYAAFRAGWAPWH